MFLKIIYSIKIRIKKFLMKSKNKIKEENLTRVNMKKNNIIFKM